MTNGAGKRWLAVVLTVLLVGVVASILVGQREQIGQAYQFSALDLAAMMALVLLTQVLRAVTHSLYFRHYEVAAGPYAWFALVSVNSLINFLPLAAGVVAKGVYLKRVYSLSVPDFVLAQTGMTLLTLSATGVTGMVLLAGIEGLRNPHVFAILFVLLFANPFLFVAGLRRAAHLSKRAGRLAVLSELDLGRIFSAWPWVGGLQVANLVVVAFALQLAFGMGGFEAGILICLLLACVNAFAGVLTITPGAIGIRELLVAAAAHGAGADLTDALVVATTLRLAEILVVLVFGLLFVYGVVARGVGTSSDRQ